MRGVRRVHRCARPPPHVGHSPQLSRHTDLPLPVITARISRISSKLFAAPLAAPPQHKYKLDRRGRRYVARGWSPELEAVRAFEPSSGEFSASSPLVNTPRFVGFEVVARSRTCERIASGGLGLRSAVASREPNRRAQGTRDVPRQREQLRAPLPNTGLKQTRVSLRSTCAA